MMYVHAETVKISAEKGCYKKVKLTIAGLMAERMVNAMVLVLRRFPAYLRCRVIFFFGPISFDRI